jgi:hypothetical protein
LLDAGVATDQVLAVRAANLTGLVNYAWQDIYETAGNLGSYLRSGVFADVFSGSSVTGGWPIPRGYRKRKSEKTPVDEPSIAAIQEQIQETAKRLLARQKLRKAEQRDRELTEQIREALAEQDALKFGVLSLESQLEQQLDDEALAIILALAS